MILIMILIAGPMILFSSLNNFVANPNLVTNGGLTFSLLI